MFAASVGCSSLNSSGVDWNPLKSILPPKANSVTAQPASMAVVWKDSIYEQPGVPSVRGFGGRFFVYDRNNNPVKIDGELVVYGYDESNPIHSDASHTGADKKFVFPREALQRHFSESDLGPSYSVWVPWEEVGGVRKSITLIPVFKTSEGNVIRCGHSLIVLPGRQPKSETANFNGIEINKTPNLVAHASFQQIHGTQENNRIANTSANTDATTNKPGLRTTTFNVPQSLAQKLSAKPTPQASKVSQLPLQHKFPHPESATESGNAPFTNPGASSDPKRSTTETTRPTPKVFGMPGSF